MVPAIFLDRDGVLIENQPDYVRNWSQVSVFPQALEALRSHTARNYKIVIVTNQSAVGRRLISLKTAENINNKLVKLIKEKHGHIDGVYMCPHIPSDLCSCRKPEPGLLLQATRELSIDLQRSWMIGDAWSDLLAGKAAGIKQVALLKTGRGKEQLLQPSPTGLTKYFVFNDLAEAFTSI